MLSKFSVKKAYTVIVGIVLIIILGTVSLSKMSTDLLPSMNLPYAIVMTTYSGASPEQVERVVTQPIEGVMASTSNIKNISSTSSNNMSMVVLEFEQSANMDSVTVEMRESLDQISGYWPKEVGNPIIMKLNPDMMPIMIAAVEVEGMDDLEISDYTEKDLIPEIKSVEGVASVSGTGLIEESVHVTLSQQKIDAVNAQITASLDRKFSEAEQELESAKSKISSGKDELSNGQRQMAGQISDAQNQLNDKKIELFQTETDLNNKLAQLREARTQAEQGIATLTDLKSQVEALMDSKAKLTQGIAAMLELGQDASELEEQLAEVETALVKIIAELAAQDGSVLKEGASEEKLLSYLVQKITEAEQGLIQINGGIAAVETGLSSVAEGKNTINDTLATLNQSQIASSVEMGSASAQLASGEDKLKESKESFEDSKAEAYDAADLNNILTMDSLTNILTA